MSVNHVGGNALFYGAVNVGRSKDGKVQETRQFQSTAVQMLLEGEEKAKLHAAFACDVRRISYEDSDCVKIYATEGFTLKAQVQTDVQRVYVEQKNEDGTYQAYEVNPLAVDKNTKNPVEQIAVEAWKAARAGSAEPTAEYDFEKMLEEFRAFVEKRLKDGPPKIPIGGTEFSEEEWEQLLRKIDKEINAYKEELRQRIQKQNEEADEKRAGNVEESKNLAGTKKAVDEKPDAKAAKKPDISESEAISGQNSPQRGRSFLARLSGEKKAPYSYLADASGMIMYKGVTFVCDDKKQQICLGDMSDTKNVLTIPLAKGGCLKVNRNNLGELAKAIDMFSPEDIGRILRAVAQDTRARQMEFEIEMQDFEF